MPSIIHGLATWCQFQTRSLTRYVARTRAAFRAVVVVVVVVVSKAIVSVAVVISFVIVVIKFSSSKPRAIYLFVRFITLRTVVVLTIERSSVVVIARAPSIVIIILSIVVIGCVNLDLSSRQSCVLIIV